jgi:hypothetical protein
MTLGELKVDLRKHGIRPIATLRMRTLPNDNGWDRVVIYFSSDEKVVFPYAPKNVHPLVLKTDSDDQVVHSEKIKALKRSLLPDWDEE